MLFDTTLRRDLARTFGATLVVIMTIVLTIMLMRTIGQAARGVVAPQDIVLFLGYTALGHLATILSLTLFISVVTELGRMYRDSEMAVWFASGAALSRFVKPVLRMAWPVLLVVGLLMLFVWPWGNEQSVELRDRYQRRSDISRVAPGVFQTSSDGSRVFFVERDLDEKSGQSNARNVFVLVTRDNKESVVAANTGRIEARGGEQWLLLERGQRNDIDAKTGEKAIASFESYEILMSDSAASTAQAVAPKVKSTLELLSTPTQANQGELTWRFGMILGAGNLLLLGIGLANRNPRRPSNWNVIFALLAFVVYFNLINLSQAWVTSGRYGMGPALLVLHGTTLVLAITLIWWRDYSAVIKLNPLPARRTATQRVARAA